MLIFRQHLYFYGYYLLEQERDLADDTVVKHAVGVLDSAH